MDLGAFELWLASANSSLHDRNKSQPWTQQAYDTEVALQDVLRISWHSSSTSSPDARWIVDVSEFAQSGILQASVLIISAIWVAAGLAQQPKTSRKSTSKASAVRWPYELLSQAARAASVAFAALACSRGHANGLNVIVLAYGLLMGLLRLLNNLEWRHLALHQVNFVYTSMLLILTTAQFLPCIQIGGECSRGPGLVGAIVALSVAFVVAFATPREWLPPRADKHVPPSALDEPAPEETCSWLNYYCSYEWMTPIIWRGTRRALDMSAVPKLAWYDEPSYLLRKISQARAISKGTLWTTLRFQRTELCLMSLWICLAFVVENVPPYGMYKLLEYLADPKGATYQPWVWLLIIFVGPVSRSVLYQQYIFVSTRLVVRIKSAMIQELYHKALGSMELEEDPFDLQKDGQKAGQKTTSAGRLANLMAADVESIYKARDFIIISVGVPAGTIFSVVGMYRMLGWPSLIGTFVIVVSVPISGWLGSLIFKTQRGVRKAQDGRISLVTEYLASIRAIKYFAWEDPIERQISNARASEQKQLWHVAVLQATINQVGQIIPLIGLVIMFGLHVGPLGNRLDASVAFTTAFLVKSIRRNIMQASYLARNVASALVSIGRLDKYFESTVPLESYPEGPLQIKNGCFRRNKTAAFCLEDISLDFAQGGLNVISGASGSGKTTLLLAILGETYLEGGSVTRPGDVAFASQSSWLQNESIQNNIIFGSPIESARYDRVIEACCLPTDLVELPDGDKTIVGENGTSLSGGQRARVALARALYSKAPLLLLDDIFSALDAKTSALVWKYCFCSDLLHGRTTVLVTQVPWIASQGDFAVTLDNGIVTSAEANIGVVRQPITVAEVLGGDTDDMQVVTQLEDAQDDVQAELQPNGDALNDTAKAAEEKPPNNIVDQEMKASGKAGRLTFLSYMNYFGHPLFTVACLLCLVTSNVFAFAGSLWLSVWVEAYDDGRFVNVAYYMGMFTLLALLEIGSYAAIILLFEWGAWRAAKRLHQDFIHSVLRVSLSWFKAIPVGRITNRFSADMASIDSMLSQLLRMFLDNFVQLFFRIAAVSSIMPVFMVPSFFTCLFGIFIGELYTRTAVIVKRLTSSAQSPVFSQFADTLAGLPIIRARAGMSEAFGKELADKLRVWSASAETGFNCNRWVSVRVDFATALVTLCAGIIAVSKAGVVGAGLVGFSLSTATGLSQTILMFVRAMNDLEVEMQSFHRVKEYVKLEPEEKNDKVLPEEGSYADDATQFIPKNWPCSGEIEFRNVTIRYDPSGPDILSDVNLKFRAGERVAVVGRTGSGKSTLVLSLLRFTHVVSGQIFYDGVDITKVPRQRLREGLTIIPQEAVLFNGTVRSNLDPTGHVPTEVLEASLQNCKGIASFASSSSSSPITSDNEDEDSTHAAAAQGITLDTEVNARGENFSHGQRQVLSLCRALIRRSKLMLLDEATASMDYETDQGIQQVLRDDIQAVDAGGRTLVTIAHRLRTIIDYDAVVVMSAGRVVEHGSPRELYGEKGLFHDMVQHSGEIETLKGFLEGEEDLG